MGTKWILYLLGLTIVQGEIFTAKFLKQEYNAALTNSNNISSVHILEFEHSNSNMSLIDLLRYRNVTVADTITICSYFRTVSNVSEKCGKQLEIVCENSTLLMTMLDASAKFPYAGLQYSTRMEFGNFDQCLTVDHTYSGGRILGEYCAVGLAIPDIFGDISDVNSYYKLALCRPDACIADDYNAILNNLTSFTLGLFTDFSCVTAESNTSLNGGDIATLSVFLVVIILMVLSTIYDICLYYKESNAHHPLLLSFSVLTNSRKLLHITKHPKSKEQIESFHGIRVISMMWIVAGHGLAIFPDIPSANEGEAIAWLDKTYSFYLTSGPLAVDTFFVMSGFLLAFQYFKSKTKTLKEQVIDIPRMYVHRYCVRLTPAMIMVYLVIITFFIRMGDGPLWTYFAQKDMKLCKTNWLKFFFYIQNYNDEDDICMIQTWYLSPIVLIPIFLHLKKYGIKVVMVELLIWDIFWTFVPMSTKYIIGDEILHYFDTHARVINYSIGITLGLFMRVKIEEPFLYMINKRHRSIINLLAWPVVILGMLAILICYHYQELHTSLFDVLMRSSWCIGLSWITYSCYHGQGGFVNWILCRPMFQVLGKLTYCVYLTHISVIAYFANRTRAKWYFSDYDVFYQFCGHYIMSLVVATFWTLAFESPIMILEKYLLGGGRKSKEPTNPQNERNEDISKAAA